MRLIENVAIQLRGNSFYKAILLPGVLFIIVLFLFKPAFNTDVDIYFLYTLSGGYGNEPSALLHYLNGAHPLLGSIVAGLFRSFPGFNWYSFSLVLFHYTSCIVLLMSLLHHFDKRYAIVIFVIFFLFIESRLLLHFNFSGAALIGVISGSVSLLLYYAEHDTKASRRRRWLFVCLLLVLIGALIRIHYLGLFGIFLLSMAAFFLSRKNFVRLSIIYFFLALAVAMLFVWQRSYFRAKIPGWRIEERMRRANIYFSNHPHKDSSVIKTPEEKLVQDLISISFLYDSGLTDYKAVRNFGTEQTKGFKSVFYDFPSFYWLFMELRVYLCLFAIMAIYLILSKNYKQLFRFICMSFTPAMTLIILTLFFKTTEVILLASLASILLSGFLCLANVSGGRSSTAVVLSLGLLTSLWMIIRIIKISNRNIQRISIAQGVIKELNANKDILFVDAGSFFNFHLSIWDLPKNYPIHNLIYNELFFSNSYRSQLKRYGINDLMMEIPVKKNIYLTGQNAKVLIDYYRLMFGRQVVVKKVPGFNYIDAYQVSVK